MKQNCGAPNEKSSVIGTLHEENVMYKDLNNAIFLYWKYHVSHRKQERHDNYDNKISTSHTLQKIEMHLEGFIPNCL